MSLQRFSKTVTALLILSGTVWALPQSVSKSSSIEGITEYTFPNGLRVLLFPDPSSPKVTVTVTYLVGSRDEVYGQTGMAHLLEHMLYIRTASGRDIKKELTDRGAKWNGTTWYDRTNYYETITASDENLRWALNLEAERMVATRIDRALLDTEMTVVRNEFEYGENLPARILEERVVAAAYIWHNYGKSPIGALSDIEHVSIDQLTAFYQKYYQPDNAVLSIAGNFQEGAVLDYIAASMGRIQAPARRLVHAQTIEPAQDGERSVVLRRVGDTQELIALYHIPAAAHPDTAALDVLAGIMGGNGAPLSGRLYDALVGTRKALSVVMAAHRMHDPGYIVASAQLSREQSLQEARDLVIGAMEGLANHPPSKEEVDRVKNRISQDFEKRMSNSQSICGVLSEWIAVGDWRLMFLHRDRIEQVNPEDIVRVAKAYLIASNRTVGEFVPTSNPVRAEIPAASVVTNLLKDYTGRQELTQGETIDPSPSAIEKRVVRSTLSSGMRLVMLPRKTRGSIVIARLQLHFGNAQSLSDKRAVAQLTGALLMRTTKNKTNRQIQDQLDRLKTRIVLNGGGGMTAASKPGAPLVSGDASGAGGYIETTAEHLDEALRLTAELLREPFFRTDDFEQVRAQRIAALEAMHSDPTSLAALEFERRLSPHQADDPRYLGSLDEQIGELKRTTLDDVVQFHQQFYCASHAELVVMGQFDPDKFRKTAEELFGQWTSQASYSRLVVPYKEIASANLKIETPDKKNAIFHAGVRIRMADSDRDYPAMVLANFMFGGTLSSRMPNRIRNVEGLSYGVVSRFLAPPDGDGALFSIWAICAPTNVSKLEASFLDELKRTLNDGFSDAEVEAARKAFLAQQIISRSQDQTLLRTLAAREHDGRTMQWDSDLEDRIQSITTKQVNSVFRNYLKEKVLTIVKAGDFQKTD